MLLPYCSLSSVLEIDPLIISADLVAVIQMTGTVVTL